MRCTVSAWIATIPNPTRQPIGTSSQPRLQTVSLTLPFPLHFRIKWSSSAITPIQILFIYLQLPWIERIIWKKIWHFYNDAFPSHGSPKVFLDHFIYLVFFFFFWVLFFAFSTHFMIFLHKVQAQTEAHLTHFWALYFCCYNRYFLEMFSPGCLCQKYNYFYIALIPRNLAE